MSDLDIESGQDWNSRITGELINAKFGIICVTPENQERPWLNFEAGAISKQVNADETRVAPLLIDFNSPADLTGPMTKFHSRLSNAEGIRRLIFDMNTQLQEPLKEEILGRTFLALWPQLETQLLEINSAHPEKRAARRDEREVMEEILNLVRGIHTNVGTGSIPRRRQKSETAKDLSKIVNEILEVYSFQGRHMTGWDGSRFEVTTDTALDDAIRTSIREAALTSSTPSTAISFIVDPDELDQMYAYVEAQAHNQPRSEGLV